MLRHLIPLTKTLSPSPSACLLSLVLIPHHRFSQTPPAPAPAPAPTPAPSLSEKPSLLSAQQIKTEMPQLYQELEKEAAQLESRAVQEHEIRLKEIRERMTKESMGRVEKISQILAGLTHTERELLKIGIIARTEKL